MKFFFLWFWEQITRVEEGKDRNETKKKTKTNKKTQKLQKYKLQKNLQNAKY
jgi:hypothetical protein